MTVVSKWFQCNNKMAFIYFVIFICSFCNVSCKPCELQDDEIIIKVFVPYLVGVIMLFMVIIITYLCFIIYKAKKDVKNIKTSNVNEIIQKQPTRNFSKQNLNNSIHEVDIKETKIDICTEEKRTPITTKKPLVAHIPIMQKQQMDLIITQVLQRNKKTESSTFRDLIELTKHKSSEVSDNLLRKRSLSLNVLDTQTNETYNSRENNYENQNADTENIVLEAPKEVQDSCEIYDTLPRSTVVYYDEVYDTLPNALSKSNDELSCRALENSDIYEILPSTESEKNDKYDEYDNLIDPARLRNLTRGNNANTMSVYDVLPSTLKRKNTRTFIDTNYSLDKAHEKQRNTRTIIDTETNYSLLIADETSQSYSRYVNANSI